MEHLLAEMQEKIRQAHATGTSLRIMGGGSKAFWVCPDAQETLAVSDYSGIVDYEPSELVVTVRAGTRLTELESILSENGQMLPFEPPHFGSQATLGGTLACGLSGPRRFAAGSARDFVLGIRMLDGLGNDLSFGGRVIKNVAGFDVSRLMVGTFGSLGVVTEASLKVLPKPVCEVTLEWDLSEHEAIDRMNRWAGLPLPVSATSFEEGRLRVRLSGSEAGVESAARKLCGERIEHGEEWWGSLREQEAALFHTGKPLWRLSVKSCSPPLGLSGSVLVEWGGALRWVASDHLPAQLYKTAQDHGGHAQLFRGGDPARPSGSPLPAPLMEINRKIKQQFDPKSIFNPGVPSWL